MKFAWKSLLNVFRRNKKNQDDFPQDPSAQPQPTDNTNKQNPLQSGLTKLTELTGKIKKPNVTNLADKTKITEWTGKLKQPGFRPSIGAFKVFLAKLSSKFQKNGGRPAGFAPLPKSVQAPSTDIWSIIEKRKIPITCAAIILCSFIIADLVATLILPFIPNTPMTKRPATAQRKKVNLNQYNQIYSRNLFNEKGLIPDPRTPIHDPDAPAVKTSLPLNLLGTIILKDEIKSVASVEDRSQQAVIAVRINENINSNVVVTKIETNKVTFYNKNTSRNEYIDIPQKRSQLTTRQGAPKKFTPAASGKGVNFVSETEVKVDRKAVDAALANFSEILTQARCVPHMENGRANGFRCFQIVPGSIYDQLGIKNQDVICAINGEPLNNPAQAIAMFQKLQTARKIELCIITNGQRRDVNYEIQ